jgi:hypothetical protein
VRWQRLNDERPRGASRELHTELRPGPSDKQPGEGEAVESRARARPPRVPLLQLTVASHPKANQRDCLKRKGNLIVYWPVSVSKRRPAYARFFTPSGNIECEMVDSGTSQASVTCDMQKPPAIAELTASGTVSICQHQGLQCTGNLGESPTPPRKLSYGHSVRV